MSVVVVLGPFWIVFSPKGPIVSHLGSVVSKGRLTERRRSPHAVTAEGASEVWVVVVQTSVVQTSALSVLNGEHQRMVGEAERPHGEVGRSGRLAGTGSAESKWVFFQVVGGLSTEAFRGGWKRGVASRGQRRRTRMVSEFLGAKGRFTREVGTGILGRRISFSRQRKKRRRSHHQGSSAGRSGVREEKGFGR